MKIRHQLVAGFTTVVLLVAAVGIVSLLQLHRIARPLREDIPEAVAAVARLEQQDSLSQLIRYYDEVLTQSARNFAFTDDPKWQQRYQDAEPKLDAAIKEALRAGDAKDGGLFASIDKAHPALVGMEYKSMDLVRAGRAKEAVAILDGSEYWDPKAIYQKGLTEYAQRRARESDDALDASAERIQSASRLAQHLLNAGIPSVLGVVIAAVLLATAIGLVISRSISRPLEQLRRAMAAIGRGDLNVVIGVPSDDEMGQLAGSFSEMATNLRNITTSIGSLSGEIAKRQHAEEQIRQNSQIQAALNKLLSLSLEDLTMEEILGQAIDHITSTAGFALESKGAAFLVNDKRDMLVMAAQRGMAAPLLTLCARVPFGRCTCGRAALSGEVAFVNCVNERHENTFEDICPHGHYCVPILSGGRVLGVINTYVKEGHLRRRDEEEFLRAAAAVLAGVIQRKRAEEAFTRLAAIIEATPDFVGFADAKDAHILYINRGGRKMTGVGDEEDVTKLKIADVHPDWVNKLLSDVALPTAARERLWEGECAFLNRDGREVPVSMVLQSHRNDSGEIQVFSTISRDITERKQIEKQQAELIRKLCEVNQELRDFAYVVSHDLKAPLRAIRTLAEWLRADYQDKLDPQGKENLQLLGSRVDRMQNLIDGVLQYSRVGRTEEGTAPVDLSQIVPEIIENLGVPEHIAIRIEPNLPTVEGDVTRITQVFQNLLSNAIKYMDKPQGNITVGCVEEDGFWKFSVSDNGPGIEEKHFDRIFKLFQTLAPRDGCESTGVGLTITKKIVGMYGGKIWVESEVGKGSTFFFTLPRQRMEVSDAKVRTDAACTL